MTTTTRTAPDLDTKLREATTEAEQCRAELSQAEADLAAAVESGDYRAAEQAKVRAEEIRPHLVLAEASRDAFAGALRHLHEHEQAAHAAAAQQAREAAADAAMTEAMAAENEARESAERHLAEALAGVEAVRASLQLAREAEQAGHAARHQAHHARAERDGTPMQTVVAPNWVSSRIDRNEVLTAIWRGRRTH